MQVVAVNSSPSRGKGNTAAILDPFLEGMREAGAEVELLYTHELKIKPCRGDLNCWLRTPGECSQKDDMQWVLPKLRDADVMVFATPLYVDGMSGPMKGFFDRMIPMGQPFIEIRDGHCRHPARDERPHRLSMVLISSCGFWELDNFNALVTHFEAMCRNFDADLAGALLRPHAGALKAMLDMGAPIDDVLEAARDAGTQLVQGGKIRAETLATVSRELLPRDLYLQQANQHFHQAVDEAEARLERKRARAARAQASAARA